MMLTRVMSGVRSGVAGSSVKPQSCCPVTLRPTCPRRTVGCRVVAFKESSQKAQGPACDQLRDTAAIQARIAAANEALKSDAMFCYQCEQTKVGSQ